MNMKDISAKEMAECDSAVGQLMAFRFSVARDTLNVGAASYVISRPAAGTMCHLAFCLLDHQTEADIVITAMHVMRQANQRKGIGSAVIRDLLAWARQCGLSTDIRATQVQDYSVGFWEKMGFVRMPEPNATSDYQYLGT